MDTDVTTDLTFEPPGPGEWELDATHRGRRPFSRLVRRGLKSTIEDSTRELMAGYGLPLEYIRVEYVHGCVYMRPVPIGEGDKPSAAPPTPIMWLIARLHPEMRRRNRAARSAWEQKRWRAEVDRWFDHDRAEVVAANLELQRVDPGSLDNSELVDHITSVAAHFITQAGLNMETHGGDMVPTGDYLAHCRRWGIDDDTATALLAGASRATTETAELLAPVARGLAAASDTPASIAEIRALGPAVGAAIDQWLDLHGWRLVTTDDIDKPTLAERPELQLAALLAAIDPAAADTDAPDASEVRRQVPAAEQPLFDELLAEARYGMRQRDDNVGIRWNWSGGLLRRAVLEAGHRLADRGGLRRADHAVDLEMDELRSLLLHGRGPDADEVAARFAERDAIEAAHPPDMLGKPEGPPPLDAFPAPLARATTAMMTMLEAEGLSSNADDPGLSGSGIGTEPYRGRARVAATADEALDRLEPGDVLVVPFTGPSYNSIIPLLGALVVESGGPMCHAAIVAREFGLPAVVGAAGATVDITDGAMIEVDPTTGVVQVIA
ncbi:MAG: PEP-utilizing enzyme [Acidimicrobiia bacterium]|nr:PEP-utilizing enzyme [Acidimicrobiia bacterium]